MIKSLTERFRAQRFQLTHRLANKIAKENYEHLTFRHRCRHCGLETDRTGVTLNRWGFCSVLCHAESVGHA